MNAYAADSTVSCPMQLCSIEHTGECVTLTTCVAERADRRRDVDSDWDESESTVSGSTLVSMGGVSQATGTMEEDSPYEQAIDALYEKR